MIRCLPRLRAAPFSALVAAALVLPCAFATTTPATVPAQALTPSTAAKVVVPPSAPGALRNFPEAALRGTLVVSGMYDAKIGDKVVRMAPGVRLFSPQNSLIQAHTVIGQALTVNYVMEASTGMLLTAWVLSQSEAAEKRKTQ